MRENFSGAQKNIYRLLINLNRERHTSYTPWPKVTSPLTELASKEGIETRIVPFPERIGGVRRQNTRI